MTHLKWRFVLAALAVLLCSVLLLMSVLTPPAGVDDAQVKLDASEFDLATYRGNVVYVDFWASWCVPCRASFPFMAELAKEHRDDLTVIAINIDAKRQDADNFLTEFNAPFVLVFDSQGSIANAYEVPGMPTSYLYDRNGVFIEKHIGFRDSKKAAIRQSVEALIKG